MKNKHYYSDNGIDWVKTNNLLGTKGVKESEVKLSIEGSKVARIAKAHSTLVSCIGDVGKMGYITSDSAYNQQINAVTFNEDDVFWKYGMYYISVQKEQHQYYQNGNVLKILNTENQKRVVVPVPKIEEQKKIAAFLDEKVAHIDNIIEDTKKSIENLKFYKQSLITETVTKGLDSNVEMKDSGIEWIGKIPKYWKVEKTKYSYKFNKGLSITKADLIDEGIPVINYGEIHSKYGVKFNPEKHIVKKVNPDYKRYNNALLKYGDVIFADTSEDIDGSGNFTTFLGETNCFAGYHTVVLKPIKRNNYIFMTYLFDSLTYRRQVRNMVQGIKVFSITQSILKNTYVWLPPIKEQNEIAIYLENKIPTLDKMISEKEKIIEELKDYKKSLIYEYVTGKKEVK